MNETIAQEILNKIVKQVFGYENSLGLEQFKDKFAFDVRLPQKVIDISDGLPTWAASVEHEKFTKFSTLIENGLQNEGIVPKQTIRTKEELLSYWDRINIFATERQLDSQNITQSDGVVECENIYRSIDIGTSKNIIFSDGMSGCEFLAASQRCRNSTFCIRLEDSSECSNSFGISCSSKIESSFMLHSCYDMRDSMFCTGLKGKRYCVANMQYTEEEYENIKSIILEWMLPRNT